MNIQSQELIDRLARFPHLFKLQPSIGTTGQFIPISWSRGVLLDPTHLRLMAKECVRLIDFETVDVVAGIELQGVSLAVAIAMEAHKPMVITREKPKRVGRTAVVGDRNFLSPGTRVLLVDDLMAFGGTKENRIVQLEEYGAVVHTIFVFIHAACIAAPHSNADPRYAFDAHARLRERGVAIHALIDLLELSDLQSKAGMISPELADIIRHNADAPYWEDSAHLQELYQYMREENITIEDFVLQFMRERGVDIT